MTQALWLPGWCMPPAVFPKKTLSDLFSVPIHSAQPWPGYLTEEQSVADLWTTESLVAWLDKQIDGISGGQPIILIGWSMGGLLALCYARCFPHKVARLSVWAASAYFMENDSHFGQTTEAVNRLYQSIQAHEPKAVYRFLKSLVSVTPAYREARRSWSNFVDENLMLPNWKALASSLNWLAQTDIRDQLKDIHSPVDIHHGTSDVIIPIEAGEYLVKHLPYSNWYPHEEKGHAWWVG